MAIINTSYYYYLGMWADSGPGAVIQYRGGNPSAYHMRNWDDGYDYYYIAVGEGSILKKYPLHTWLPDGILTRLRNDPTFCLCVHNSHEAFDSIVAYIYSDIIMQYNIVPSKVLLLTNSFDIKSVIEQVAAKYRLPILRAEIMTDFEFDMHIATSLIPKHEMPITLVYKDYPKKFLNFNRRWRLHRPLFVGLLTASGLLDSGYVSLAKSDDNKSWDDMYPELLHAHYGCEKLLAVLRDNEHIIKTLPDLYLDTTDLVTNRAQVTTSTNMLYENTYFSVVSETYFYKDSIHGTGPRFLSEKAFKPILFKHPFIVISTPGILDAYRSIGYKTFSPLIDETYDTLTNNEDRILAILDEVKRLATLDKHGLRRFVNGCKEIVEYNYKVLATKKIFSYKAI